MSPDQKTSTKVSTNQKRQKHLRVPVLLEEEQRIKLNAEQAGLSIAEYLRRVALGFEIKSRGDHHNILELAKINADLGRLGGLLKLWLTRDERLSHIDPKAVIALLDRIKKTQSAMLEAVEVLKGRG